jgi:uncharacterized RDD family membrane protein YckC
MRGFKTVKINKDYVPAPYWKRFLAYLIDFFIVGFLVTLPFRKVLSEFDFVSQKNDPIFGYISLIFVIVIIFYSALLEYKLGQTLGKMLLGISTVSLTDKNLKFSQAFLRNLTKPFSIVFLVDILYMLFKKNHQRLFEVFSNTLVVNKKEMHLR